MECDSSMTPRYGGTVSGCGSVKYRLRRRLNFFGLFTGEKVGGFWIYHTIEENLLSNTRFFNLLMDFERDSEDLGLGCSMSDEAH